MNSLEVDGMFGVTTDVAVTSVCIPCRVFSEGVFVSIVGDAKCIPASSGDVAEEEEFAKSGHICFR